MDITEAKQIVSKYGRNSKMSILYNESPLKLINGNKLEVNYLPSNLTDGSWSPELEEYTIEHKAAIIEYFNAREIIFEHSLAKYDKQHDEIMMTKK